MKNYLILAALGLLTLQSCNNHQAELDRALQERDSLLAVMGGRDSSINEFVGAFNEIQANLDSVTARSGMISGNMTNQGELQQSTKDRINDDISAINNIMAENSKKIAELNRKLRASGGKNKKLQEMVASLNAQMADKNRELSSLNDQLAALNANVAMLQISVDTLSAEKAELTKELAEQTTTMHTAHYVIGKTKDLEKSGVIDKKGGLLGMGKTSTMSDKIDDGKFTTIDYTKTTSIPVNTKAKVITTHPEDSYSLDKDDKGKVTNLRITNPEKFWSASKYLVVITD